MNFHRQAAVLGCGVVDGTGVAGTRGTQATWSELGVAPPGTAKVLRLLFDRQDPTFRRGDLLTKALVLACEAADLDGVLGETERHDTAILVETDVGALETDLQFAASLGDALCQASVFPYSLTSTCLGEIALRHGIRGPTVSISARPDQRGDGLREALRMFAAGEVRHAIVGTVDALLHPTDGVTTCLCATVAVLAAEGRGRFGAIDWPASGDDPWPAIARRCR